MIVLLPGAAETRIAFDLSDSGLIIYMHIGYTKNIRTIKPHPLAPKTFIIVCIVWHHSYLIGYIHVD